MQRIVVGVDGSTASARALEYAAEEATRSGRQLEIVHAVDLPTEVDFYGVRVGAEQVDTLQRYAEEVLASARKRVAELHPDLTCRSRHQIGAPTAVLIEASQDAAALVVGSRGLGGLGRAVLGSVSIRVATGSGCPVFVVGEQDSRPADGPIVVGVDDSKFSIAALRFAIAEARVRRTSVRAVNAYRSPALAVPVEQTVITELSRSEQDEAARILGAALAAVGADRSGIEVESLVEEGAPADVLLDLSADAQLIVIGSHGKGLVRRLLLGSVSRQVLHDADGPVVVVDVGEG